MNQNERDELLIRLDERTEGIERDVKDAKEVNIRQNEQIAANRKMAVQNRTIINMVTLGVGSAFTAVFGKLSGLLEF